VDAGDLARVFLPSR